MTDGLFDVRTHRGRRGLDAIVADPSGAVIGSDFDGTLAPIVPDPDAARIHPAAPAALLRLSEAGATVVIITGRPAAGAIAYGTPPTGPGLADVPGLVVLGQYGAERWENGEVTAPPPPPGLDEVRAALPGLVAGMPGVGIEDKGRAVAVHTRRHAAPDEALAALRAPLAALAEEHGLTVEPGRMVIELRPPGTDKGAALTAFLAERSARSVLFAGDDLGDMAAFDAVDASDLPGVTVGSASAELTTLTDRADVVAEGPDGVVALLDRLAAALDGGSL